MVHISVGSLAESGLHTRVIRSLRDSGVDVPRPVQRKLFSTLRASVPTDVILEAPAHSGRHTALIAFAASRALTERRAVFVVPANTSSCLKLQVIFDRFHFDGDVEYLNNFLVPDVAAFEALRTPAGRPLVVMATLAHLQAVPIATLQSVCTLIIEDVFCGHDAAALQSGVERFAVASVGSRANMVLFSSRAPSEVPKPLRYALRHRQYLFLDDAPATPNVTTLLCLDTEDRTELCIRSCEIPGLCRVMILTHNRDVREFRAYIQRVLGLRTFSIQRTTSLQDRQKTIAEFLESRFAVLVAMDAFTGVDLMDVDAVIQMYPPQKSMGDDDWEVFVTCLQGTINPVAEAKPLLITIAAPDDLTMVQYFMNRAALDVGPVLNVSPTHVQFGDLVRNPDAVLAAKAPRMHQLMAATSAAAAPAAVAAAADDAHPATSAASKQHHHTSVQVAHPAAPKQGAAAAAVPFAAQHHHHPPQAPQPQQHKGQHQPAPAAVKPAAPVVATPAPRSGGGGTAAAAVPASGGKHHGGAPLAVPRSVAAAASAMAPGKAGGGAAAAQPAARPTSGGGQPAAAGKQQQQQRR